MAEFVAGDRVVNTWSANPFRVGVVVATYSSMLNSIDAGEVICVVRLDARRAGAPVDELARFRQQALAHEVPHFESTDELEAWLQS